MPTKPAISILSMSALCLMSGFVQAGYNTCGSTLYPSSTRTCPDGSLAMYHSGEPASFSAASLDFGNVLVGSASEAQSVTISNTSAYSLALPSAITLSDAFYRGSTTDCGTTLAAGSSCTLNVVFTPSATGAASGEALVATGVATYAITLSGTGIVTTGSNSSGGNSSGDDTSGGSTGSNGATHATKPAPTSCTSYLGGSTLGIPYLSVGGIPMWAELQSTGSLLNYKVVDYGPLSGSTSCAADGATLAGLENLSLGKLYYDGGYYTAALRYAGTATDGSLLFNVTGASAYQNGTGGSSSGSLDHSILVGEWALHYGVSTVTFRDDGTYYAPNGGTGTYSWSGDTLNIDGALTSGNPGTAIFEVTASATWMQISWPSSYGGTASMVYYKRD